MALGDVGYLPYEFKHGAVVIEMPTGASLTEVVTFTPVGFGPNVFTQLLLIQHRGYEAELSNLQGQVEIAVGVVATLAIKYKTGSGTLTASTTNMMRGTGQWSFISPPYSKNVRFTNSGDSTLSIAA